MSLRLPGPGGGFRRGIRPYRDSSRRTAATPLLVDGKPYLMLGGQVNNSSSWPDVMPRIWPTIEKLHANTVEMPIYWEQFEPQQGHFDDSTLHVLLDQAREHHVHLVLLWFGTWKNGNLHYTPEWVKTDNARYPRMVDSVGRNLDSLSPFGAATLEADKTGLSHIDAATESRRSSAHRHPGASGK